MEWYENASVSKRRELESVTIAAMAVSDALSIVLIAVLSIVNEEISIERKLIP